jgi:hypothetical protein
MEFPVILDQDGVRHRIHGYHADVSQFHIFMRNEPVIANTNEFRYIIKINEKLYSKFSEWIRLPYPRGPRIANFTDADITELEENIELMDGNPMFPYEAIIAPLKGVLKELKKSRNIYMKQLRNQAKSEGRNLLAGKTAGLLDSDPERLEKLNKGVESSALKNLLGRNFFTQTVGSFLTKEPRIGQESRGTIGPALENLQKRATGIPVDPLRAKGTGTRGGKRRRNKTRKSRKNNRR